MKYYPPNTGASLPPAQIEFPALSSGNSFTNRIVCQGGLTGRKITNLWLATPNNPLNANDTNYVVLTFYMYAGGSVLPVATAELTTKTVAEGGTGTLQTWEVGKVAVNWTLPPHGTIVVEGSVGGSGACDAGACGVE